LTIFSENCGFGCKIRLVKNQKTVENKGFLAIISITATRHIVQVKKITCRKAQKPQRFLGFFALIFLSAKKR